ncbi:MAG: M15 family metallopeptidase [Pseudomonadota bacterium]|nr:M15 family metallopeptidase [Pseudomonadota bacterium]
MRIERIIRQVQQELGVEVDGKAGPQTWAAIHGRILPTADRSLVEFALEGERANARSEREIATLLLVVQPYARALYFKARGNGITVNVISGMRTFQEQDALYARGRTRPGPIVTNARGGQSVHNFGLAFDIGVFEGNRYVTDSPKYEAIGALGLELGLEWGGNWKSMIDRPHFQFRPPWAAELTDRQMLAHLRRLREEGRAYV